jgi:hypothetical protein
MEAMQKARGQDAVRARFFEVSSRKTTNNLTVKTRSKGFLMKVKTAGCKWMMKAAAVCLVLLSAIMAPHEATGAS